MESHNPQKTQNIIKDITTTELSSYQIAYKYNTTRATIGRLGNLKFLRNGSFFYLWYSVGKMANHLKKIIV